MVVVPLCDWFVYLSSFTFSSAPAITLFVSKIHQFIKCALALIRRLNIEERVRF